MASTVFDNAGLRETTPPRRAIVDGKEVQLADGSRFVLPGHQRRHPELNLPHSLAATHSERCRSGRNGLVDRADARTRTGDPFITSEVLYQLSYVGEAPTVAVSGASEARRA